MLKNRKFLLGGFIILGIFSYFLFKKILPELSIKSFEECVAAGNAVMESYPRQCRANGKTFVETLEIQNGNTYISVTDPKPNSVITNPLKIKGMARGMWFFEGGFPGYLYDETGKEIAVGVAKAEGEWMTEEFVPFTLQLAFKEPVGSTGSLVLEKSNPSGLPENADKVTIPVKFR